MQINITGHHIEVTPSLKSYVESKLKRLERHFDHISNIHVILKLEKERREAEARIEVSKGTLFADSRHEDMYAAIDLLIDKLDRQIKKHKEKQTDHHQKEGGIRGGA